MRFISITTNALCFWLGWTALAHADPITTALFGAAFASTFLGGVVSAGIGIAISYGLGLLANALSPQQSPTSTNVGTQLDLQVGGDNPLRFPLGPAADGGLRTYFGTWGNSGDVPNAYLTQVMALSDVPVTGDVAIWVNDQKCTIDWGATPTAQGYPVTEYAGKLWVRWHDGTDDTADSLMLSKFGSDPNYPYTSDMVGVGTAYVVVTALWDRNTWNGTPSFLFEVPSIALYDVRKDSTAGGSGSHRWDTPSTWEASDNPMVQAYNVARGIYYGSEWVFGGQNWPAFRLPADVWMAAMNECDADAALADGSTEKAYRSGGMVGTDSTPTDVITALLNSCSGRIAEVGGIYKVLVGANAAAVYSFTDNDIVVTEDQGYDPFPGLDSTANAITATYTEPAEEWATKDAPPLYTPDLETADDDRRLPVNIDFPLVQYNTQVQRLMRNALADSRRFRQHSHYLPPYAWLLEPLDTVSWTSARNGYTEKQFLLSSIEGEPTFLQSVGLKEIDPSDFDRDPDTEQQSYSVGELVTVRPAPQLVSGWTAVPGSFLDDDGVARHPSITITATGGMADVRALRVQVRLTSSGALVYDGDVPYDSSESSPAWTLNGTFLADTAYQVRGKLLPFSGRVTYWSNQDTDGTDGAWLDVTTPVVVNADVTDVQLTQLSQDLQNIIGLVFGNDAGSIASMLNDLQAKIAAQAAANLDDQATNKTKTTSLAVQTATAAAAIVTEQQDRIDGDTAEATARTEAIAAIGTAIADGLISFDSVVTGGGAEATIAIKVRAQTGDIFADSGILIKATSDGLGGTTSQILLKTDQLFVTDGTNAAEAFTFDATTGTLKLKNMLFEQLSSISGNLIIDGVNDEDTITGP